jgi:hypothetical protein
LSQPSGRQGPTEQKILKQEADKKEAKKGSKELKSEWWTRGKTFNVFFNAFEQKSNTAGWPKVLHHKPKSLCLKH